MRTKAHRGFLPSRLDGLELEARVVMSQGALTSPALVLSPVQQSPRALRHLSPQNRVNQAFDQFTTDYLQAQQVYLDSTGLTNADTTFKNYIAQSVNLLAQELVQALGRLPGATAKLQPKQRIDPSLSTTLQSFLFRKINGTNTTYDNISLLTALNNAVPTPAAGTTLSPAAVTLFTLQASNAIETARINTENAAYLMSSGT